MTRIKRPPGFTKAQRYDVMVMFGAIVCCQCSDPKCDDAIYINEAEIDHHLAIVDGGKHELDNWRPISSHCHARKSAREHRANAKAKRVAKKHNGTWVKKSKPIPSGRPLTDPNFKRKLSGQTERR